VQKNAFALEQATAELLTDRSFLLAAVHRNAMALEFVPRKFRNDSSFMMAVVRKNGFALKFATDAVRGDGNVVRAAIAQDSRAIEYANRERLFATEPHRWRLVADRFAVQQELQCTLKDEKPVAEQEAKKPKKREPEVEEKPEKAVAQQSEEAKKPESKKPEVWKPSERQDEARERAEAWEPEEAKKSRKEEPETKKPSGREEAKELERVEAQKLEEVQKLAEQRDEPKAQLPQKQREEVKKPEKEEPEALEPLEQREDSVAAPQPDHKRETVKADELVHAWSTVAELRAGALWPPENLLACGQELSGADADAALRSLANIGGSEPSSGDSLAVMATFTACDHHHCDWANYVNRPLIEALFPDAVEAFAMLVALSAWATEGSGAREQRLGALARALLDVGRALWLQEVLGWRKVDVVAGGDRPSECPRLLLLAAR